MSVTHPEAAVPEEVGLLQRWWRTVNARINPHALWLHIDVLLILAAAGLLTIGLAAIYSTTRGRDPADYDRFFLDRQSIFIVVGAMLVIGVAWIPYRELSKYTLAIYSIGMMALIGVLLFGEEVNGARSWYRSGDVQFQPSEFFKVGLILSLASVLNRFREGLDYPRMFLVLVMVGWPCSVVLLQPDVGTTLVYLFIGLAMLLVGGIRFRQIILLGLMATTLITIMISANMLQEYQTNRLQSFIDPTANSSDAAFQQEQAQIAIGNGGLSGKGYGSGSQTLSGLVPEQQTDFIFTVIGEEFGFLGSALTLVLFSVLLLRILQTARLSADVFGTLICVGVFSMILFQMFEAVGMTVGITPITGIPLPLVSYGGSSVLSTLICLGLVLNVRMRRFT